MSTISPGGPTRQASVRLFVGDSAHADRREQADDRFELAESRAPTEAPVHRVVAAALRNAPELEHDAVVVGRLAEELGHALSALTVTRSAQQTAAAGVRVDNGDDRDDGAPLAELHTEGLSVRMQLVNNERGETLMRASFAQDGAQRVSQDVWLGIDGASQPVPSRFTAAFRDAAASLSPRQQTALASHLRAARQELAATHSALLHQLAARELRDSAEYQRLTLLIAGPRA